MVEITDQIVRTVRIENHPQHQRQHQHGHRRRRLIIRVPPFMLIWAILFHSERIHPILHIPNSIAIKDWFHMQHQYRYYQELSTVPSSDYNLDEWVGEDEKKKHQQQHQKQYRNPCQRPGNYKMRS